MLVNVSDQFVSPFTEKCDSLKTYSTLKYIRCVDRSEEHTSELQSLV